MTIQSSNLVFEQVEDPEIIRFTHLQNSVSWKTSFLTCEEYAERERILGQTEIATKHKCIVARTKYEDCSQYLGLKYFVLKDLDLPCTSKTSQIVSSCETLNRVSWLLKPQSSGDIQQVLSACVGGVYTIPEHRGKGYAPKMLSYLNEFYDKLSNEPQAPVFLKDKVMILYSEIGDYYNKFGYVSRHVPVHFISQMDKLCELYCGRDTEPRGRFLGFDDYADLVEMQKDSFKKNMLKLQSVQPESSVFTVEPSLDIYKWFQHRDVYISAKFQDQPPSNFGFALPDGSHVIWHHHWTESALYLLKVHIVDGTDGGFALKKLLAACVREAEVSKLKMLEFWDEELSSAKYPSLFKVLAEIEDDANLHQENSSRSAVRVPKEVDADNFIWDNNTKFCWF